MRHGHRVTDSSQRDTQTKMSSLLSTALFALFSNNVSVSLPDLMTEEIINFKPVTFGKMLCNLSGKSNGSILKWDIMSRWIDGIVCKYTRTMYRARLSWRTDSSIIQSPICPH